MEHFATSSVDLGQTYSPSCQINMEKLSPIGDIVRAGVLSLHRILETDFKSKLDKIFGLGVGGTCDVLKLNIA